MERHTWNETYIFMLSYINEKRLIYALLSSWKKTYICILVYKKKRDLWICSTEIVMRVCNPLAFQKRRAHMKQRSIFRWMQTSQKKRIAERDQYTCEDRPLNRDMQSKETNTHVKRDQYTCEKRPIAEREQYTCEKRRIQHMNEIHACMWYCFCKCTRYL